MRGRQHPSAVSLTPPAPRSPCPEEWGEEVCLGAVTKYNLARYVLWGGGHYGRDPL